MNCCNDYGDCRQGRDCPARRCKVAKVGLRIPGPAPLPPSTWRKHVKDLARAMLLVMFALLASSFLVFFQL